MAYEGPHPFPVKSGGTGASTLTGVLIGNGTSAVTGNAITQHDVLVAGASNAITSVSPSTAGFVLTSNGVSVDPSFQAVSAGSGSAKAWGYINIDGSQNASLVVGFNVTSVTGSGSATVTLTSGFSSSNYVIISSGSQTSQNNVISAQITNSTTFHMDFGSTISGHIYFAAFGT